MHIHPSSPSSSISEEDAATKIQANFRGYRVRKQLKQSCNGNLASGQSNQRNTNNATAYRNERLEETNGQRFKSSKSLDKEKCATKIQAGIRGFLVRKKQRLAADAATKVQSAFRGYRTRKQLKNLKE
ncbi:IQ domain-containing protein N [Sitodiplosis mosellana]|uniref:IQ domain-containing protein N n=1 Tax=Sitodiplosis mosellana TaxID=263140 RepID=UPI002444E82B|nr:IQ domain-containing protein N [Sitodiplosis mosellana]